MYYEHAVFCLKPQKRQDFIQQGVVVPIPLTPRASVRPVLLTREVRSQIPTQHHWLGKGGAGLNSLINSTGGEFS